MYSKPLEEIPWEIVAPPKELVDLLARKIVTPPSEVLDIACGTGNYSLYLAKLGFTVTGIDFSKKALEVAKKNAVEADIDNIRYVLGDITEIERTLDNKTFDFMLDFSILHHIDDEDIQSYAAQCTNLLKKNGKLLLVCYSEKDEYASGGRSKAGTFGNKMFYRDRQEIESLYKGLRVINYFPTTLGKRNHHHAHAFLFEK
jgi:2-polyprenyl-3-methyl-5-hydroxy-6-metoxy-1,4-benzoquinol methylase